MTAVVQVPARNLPADLTSFVDRRHELSTVKQLLSTTRLVTLTGVGGVGKTRLALRLARELRRTFADGVCFVELDQLSDPNLIAHTVAGALGLREQSAGSRLAALVDHLAAEHLLLVLDNCEHLIEASAMLADTLLRACPELRIIATGREALGVQGEAIMTVPALPTSAADASSAASDGADDEAIMLFTDRAAAVLPGFQLTGENVAVVAQICRQLDGIPLAIELAAARLRSLSVEQLLERLTHRLGLPGVRRGVGAQRQQTLQASIGWSYDLCTPEEQLLWARLSVFAGGFELDAVDGVCAGDGLPPDDLLHLVSALLDKSIVFREAYQPYSRYRLPETLREFGLERLQERGEYQPLRRRHRDWYGVLVRTAEREWIGPREAEWIARLDREHANLRAAMEFSVTTSGEAGDALAIAADLHPYWIARGLFTEGRHWLDRALSGARTPTTERVRALQVDAWLAAMQNDMSAVGALLTEGHALAEVLDDEVARALMLRVDGLAAMFTGDLARLVASLETALRVFRSRDDNVRVLETLSVLVAGHALLGDETNASSLFDEFVAISSDVQESSIRCYAQHALGIGALRGGNDRRATELEREALQIARTMEDRFGTGLCLEALAWIAAGAGEVERSAALFGVADQMWRSMGTSAAVVPHLHRYREEYRAAALSALGEEGFLRASRLAEQWSEAEAVDFALGVSSAGPSDRPPRASEPVVLTRRERQIADLVAEGLSNKEIAGRLVISRRTVETHVEHILIKLGFTSRVQVASWVAQQRPRR